MKKLTFLLFSFILTYTTWSQDQEWNPGKLILQDNSEFIGDFTIQTFGTEKVVRNKAISGMQNTFPVEQVDKLWLYEGQNTLLFKTLAFDHSEYRSKPAVLFQVMYESDSIKLFQTDLNSVKKFIRVMPLPGLIVVHWGKELKNYNILMMSDQDLTNLTIINYPKRTSIALDLDLIFHKFLNTHATEVQNFIKTNKIKWRNVWDLVDVVAYYDQL